MHRSPQDVPVPALRHAPVRTDGALLRRRSCAVLEPPSCRRLAYRPGVLLVRTLDNPES